MRQALHGDGFNAGIGDNHFFFAEGSRVAVEGGFRVRVEQIANLRKAIEELERTLVRYFAEFFFRNIFGWAVFEAFVNFVLEAAEHCVEERGGFDFDFRGMNQFLVEETREQQAQQVDGNDRNGAFRGEIFAIEMIDTAGAGIGFDEPVG